MHIGIIFYSDTIAMAKGDQQVKGRAVANNGFIQALLSYPHKNLITLFVSSITEKEYIEEFFGALVKNKQTQIVSLQQLPDFLKRQKLDALHVMGPDLYRPLYLRNQVAQYPLAITGITHSLGHAPFLEWLILNLMHEPKPYDALVCTTPTAQVAMQKMIKTCQTGLAKAHELRTEVIPLGVDVAAFQTKQASLRSQMKISDDAMVFLSLSRFSYFTKADLIPLLQIFKEVIKQSQKPAYLILAGATGQENYPELLQLVIAEYELQGRVLVIVNPNDEQKKALYHSADVFVSLCDNPQETFGITIIEALAAGLPVIASEWDGYRALIQNEQNGFLIPTLTLTESEIVNKTAPLQIDSLNHLFFSQSIATDQSIAIKRFLELINDSDLRKTMADQAKASSAQYDWPVVIGKYLTLWEDLGKLAQKNTDNSSVDSIKLDYHEVFNHYATESLRDDDEFSLSDFGQAALAGKANIRRYTAMEEVLQLNLMALILKEAKQKASVNSLQKKLPSSYAIDQIRYHLIWLYKYGFVKRG